MPGWGLDAAIMAVRAVVTTDLVLRAVRAEVTIGFVKFEIGSAIRIIAVVVSRQFASIVALTETQIEQTDVVNKILDFVR